MTTRSSKSGKFSIYILYLETSNYFLQIKFSLFPFSNFSLYVSFLSIFNSLLVRMNSPNTYPRLISPSFSYLYPVQTFTPNSLHFFLFSYSLNPHSYHHSPSYSLTTPIHDPIHIVPNNLCNPLVLSHVIDSLPNCTIIVVSESLVNPTTCLNKNYLNFSLIMFPAHDNYLVNVLPHSNVHDKFITPSSHDRRFISFFNLRQETLVYLTEVPSYRKCPIHRPPQFDLEYARPRDRPTWSGPSRSKHVKSLKPTMDKLPVLAEFLDSGKSHSDSNQTYSCFLITVTPKAKLTKFHQTTQFVYTDVILAIKPKFAEAIRIQEKNHEYRKYEIKPTVTRFWLYEIEPINAIQYVVDVGPTKTPGQVQDPTGLGNEDFDNGLKKSKFGYPILGMYQLNEPLSGSCMKDLIGISPPLQYEYATAELILRYDNTNLKQVFGHKRATVQAAFLIEEFRSEISTESLLATHTRQLAKHPKDIKRTAEILKKARLASKEPFEKHPTKRIICANFKPKDLVLVRNMAIEKSHDRKQKPRYLGPYEVIAKTNKGNYQLKELDGTPLHYTCASRCIIPYISQRHSFMHSNGNIINEPGMSETDPDLDVDQSEFDV